MAGVTTIAGLTDVGIVAPADGDVLFYNIGSGKWENAQPVLGTNIAGAMDDLSDVDTTGVNPGDILVWNGAQWIDDTPDLDLLADVDTVAKADGYVLGYNGGSLLWEAQQPTVNWLQDVTLTSTADRDWLEYDSGTSQWLNRPSLVAEFGAPTGFPNRVDTALAFDSGTRTVTVSKTGADFKLWYYGRRDTKSANSTVVIPAATGLYFVSYNSIFQIGQSLTPFDFKTQIPAAILYWNNTTGDYFLGEERHGTQRDLAWHQTQHNTLRALWSSGGVCSGYTLNSTTLANCQVAVSGTVFYDEDIQNIVAARLAGDNWDKWYFTLTGWRKHTDSNLLGSNATTPSFFGATPLLGYNNIAAGTIAEVGVNDYVNTFIFSTNSAELANRFIVIPGQVSSASTAVIYAETVETLTLSGLPFVECVPVAQITWQRQAGGIGARINRVLDIRAARSPGANAGGATTTHNALGGLQGGTAAEYYHLTAAQHSDLTGGTFNPPALGTLNLGTANSSVINIGQAGVTTQINLYGALTDVYTTDSTIEGELNLDGGVIDFTGTGTAAANKIARTANGIDVNNSSLLVGASTTTVTGSTGAMQVQASTSAAQMVVGRTATSVGWGYAGADGTYAHRIWTGGTGATPSLGAELFNLTHGGIGILGPSGLLDAHTVNGGLIVLKSETDSSKRRQLAVNTWAEISAEGGGRCLYGNNLRFWSDGSIKYIQHGTNVAYYSTAIEMGVFDGGIKFLTSAIGSTADAVITPILSGYVRSNSSWDIGKSTGFASTESLQKYHVVNGTIVSKSQREATSGQQGSIAAVDSWRISCNYYTINDNPSSTGSLRALATLTGYTGMSLTRAASDATIVFGITTDSDAQTQDSALVSTTSKSIVSATGGGNWSFYGYESLGSGVTTAGAVTGGDISVPAFAVRKLVLTQYTGTTVSTLSMSHGVTAARIKCVYGKIRTDGTSECAIPGQYYDNNDADYRGILITWDATTISVSKRSKDWTVPANFGNATDIELYVMFEAS